MIHCDSTSSHATVIFPQVHQLTRSCVAAEAGDGVSPGPLGCRARAVRQVAGPRLATPCISLRVLVMLRIFLLMRVSALQPARLARAKDRAQGSPLRKEDFWTSRPHSCVTTHHAAVAIHRHFTC